jgi:hypothetical protein
MSLAGITSNEFNLKKNVKGNNMNEHSITSANIKKVMNVHEITACEFKFQAVLERFVHFQLTKLFHKLGGRSKFFNAFLVVLQDDFGMSDMHESSLAQISHADQLSNEFATVRIMQISFDDFFEPSIELGIYMEPYTESVWGGLYIEVTTTSNSFQVNRIDFGDATATPSEAQYYEVTDLLEDYLRTERTLWKYS